MELPIQYIRVDKTNYIIRKYKLDDDTRWSVESYKSTATGFKSCTDALNFLLLSHPYCVYCHTHLKEYKKATYFDFVENKDIETSMCCPLCESWNDELVLENKQEPTKDDHRKRVYKGKTAIKDGLFNQLSNPSFITF